MGWAYMPPGASLSELTGGVPLLVSGGRGIMNRKKYFIESWSQYAPFGYSFRGGRWL
jgi:hypothetical protein